MSNAAGANDQPRIVPPEEARALAHGVPSGAVSFLTDLAYTAAVLGEQRAAVLALHRRSDLFCVACHDEDGYAEDYPCPTARALGVGDGGTNPRTS